MEIYDLPQNSQVVKAWQKFTATETFTKVVEDPHSYISNVFIAGFNAASPVSELSLYEIQLSNSRTYKGVATVSLDMQHTYISVSIDNQLLIIPYNQLELISLTPLQADEI